MGVELQSTLRYDSPGGRLTVEGTVHMLVAHRSDKKAWGVGAKARLSPPGERHRAELLSRA